MKCRPSLAAETAFEVADMNETIRELGGRGVVVGPVRIDEHTGRRLTFFADPDGLPLELYQR
jgi:glyoxylase I family protein